MQKFTAQNTASSEPNITAAGGHVGGNSVVYQAIFETPEAVIFIAYEPAEHGAIFIQSVSIEPRPKSLFEQRRPKPRRGLVLNEQELEAEALFPYSRTENAF